MPDRVQTSESVNASSPAAPASISELIDRLGRFDGPPEAFLVNLLAVQCYIATANGGAMLRLNPQGQVEVLAVYPALAQGQTPPVWLAKAAEVVPQIQRAGTTLIRPLQHDEDLYGAPARQHLILVPIRGDGMVRGAATFLIETGDPQTLAVCRERIELTVSLLSLYEMRLTLQRRQADLARLRLAMEVLSAVNDHERFQGAGMAFVNELASRFTCDRVGLGFLKNRYVKLRALSNTEKFSRKMKVVQDVETAMEECIDQDVEIVHPSAPEATFVSRAAKELATRHGPSAVLSLPLRRGSEPKGVLILERPADNPFTVEEAESLRLTCDLASARLVTLHQTDKWFGARAAAATRRAAAFAVGPKHTWIKLLVIGLIGFVLATSLIHGEHRAEAPFTIEAVTQRYISAPFDGFIAETFVEPAQWVAKGDVLARMDTKLQEQSLSETRRQYVQAESRRAVAMAAADSTMKADERDAKQAEVQQLAAEMAAARVKIDWLLAEIDDAAIKAPFNGYILEGDLKQHNRPPRKKGDVLFIMAECEENQPIAMQATLEVPEEDIAEVRASTQGQLATTGYPDKRMRFTIERVMPVAEVVEQKNVYKIRVKLNEDDMASHNATAWLQPGIKGQARVHLGEQPYLKMWTQKAVNWVRMKLWI